MKFDLFNSLAIKNPEHVDEWHPEMNGSLTPAMYPTALIKRPGGYAEPIRHMYGLPR